MSGERRAAAGGSLGARGRNGRPLSPGIHTGPQTQKNLSCLWSTLFWSRFPWQCDILGRGAALRRARSPSPSCFFKPPLCEPGFAGWAGSRAGLRRLAGRGANCLRAASCLSSFMTSVSTPVSPGPAYWGVRSTRANRLPFCLFRFLLFFCSNKGKQWPRWGEGKSAEPGDPPAGCNRTLSLA